MKKTEKELIEKARERMKKGKFLTESEAKKRLGLADKLASKSKLTEKDAEEIGEKIKRGIAKRHSLVKNDEMRIFKIKYSWYEGKYRETLLGKNVKVEEFEEDLKEARKFAEGLIGTKVKGHDYLGKWYKIECLPQFYWQMIWVLMNKKGYVDCEFDYLVYYDVDETSHSGRTEIVLNKVEKITERKEIGK